MKDEKLRSVGLKVTTPRLKILQLFEDNPGCHFSADEVFQLLSENGLEIGLATVYRVLSQFEAVDLIHKHSFENDRCVYEYNVGDHHDHLVCSQCGQIKEFVDDVIESRQEAIAQQFDFKMTGHNLVIFGVCPRCLTVTANNGGEI